MRMQPWNSVTHTERYVPAERKKLGGEAVCLLSVSLSLSLSLSLFFFFAVVIFSFFLLLKLL